MCMEVKKKKRKKKKSPDFPIMPTVLWLANWRLAAELAGGLWEVLFPNLMPSPPHNVIITSVHSHTPFPQPPLRLDGERRVERGCFFVVLSVLSSSKGQSICWTTPPNTNWTGGGGGGLRLRCRALWKMDVAWWPNAGEMEQEWWRWGGERDWQKRKHISGVWRFWPRGLWPKTWCLETEERKRQNSIKPYK